VFFEGKAERHAYGEQEEGEHKVGKRPAVPGGVVKLGIDMVGHAGLIYQYHESYCDAAEHVQRNQTGGGCFCCHGDILTVEPCRVNARAPAGAEMLHYATLCVKGDIQFRF